MTEFDKLISAVKDGLPEECQIFVQQFNQKYEKARIISGMSVIQKESLWRAIFTRLDDPIGNVVIISDLLNSLRILSREKEVLESVMTEEMITCLLKSSGIESMEGPTGTVHLSGMKVIFNILFQSESLQCKFILKGLLHSLVNLYRSPKVHDIPPGNIIFLSKIFFIITALQKKCSSVVRTDLEGLDVLLTFIDGVTISEKPYDDSTAEIISEILKLLYNLIHDINYDEERIDNGKEFTELCEVTKIVRRCLVHKVETYEKGISIQSHAVHLLCAVPSETFDELIEADVSEGHEPIFYESKDVAPINVIVGLLDSKMDCIDTSPAEPILVALCKMASTNRIIRKYLKRRILPPLTEEDLKQRPEVGSTIRNKLCRLIHTTVGSATKTAATLIFVLCKESVGRMIKYTGYGNAAGLLADQGLLLGGRGPGQYSDDSDSDTEEYDELREKINSVEGWMKPEEPPLEMTEEQKEFEAMKLVQQIHQLAANKTLRPCRIGPDGKPQPIEHVLELQDGLEQVIKNAAGKGVLSDSDSD